MLIPQYEPVDDYLVPGVELRDRSPLPTRLTAVGFPYAWRGVVRYGRVTSDRRTPRFIRFLRVVRYR